MIHGARLGDSCRDLWGFWGFWGVGRWVDGDVDGGDVELRGVPRDVATSDVSFEFFQMRDRAEELLDGGRIGLLADIGHGARVEQEGHGFADGGDIGLGVLIEDVAGHIHSVLNPMVELSILDELFEARQGGALDLKTKTSGSRRGDAGADLVDGFVVVAEPGANLIALLEGEFCHEGVHPEAAFTDER